MLSTEKMDGVYEGYINRDEYECDEMILNHGDLDDIINEKEDFYFTRDVLLAPTLNKFKKNIDWNSMDIDEVFNEIYVH
tara:strand:- start:141 stop:377 length:237 start_codon:yes stop_codon:yes gene_type:complete